MSLQRRPVGRGRWIAAASALIILAGSVLPWVRSGGSDGIPAVTVNGFEGTGILVFLAALAVLALVSLPFAMGDAPVAIDRWWAYAIIAGVALLGLLLRVLEALGVQGGLGIMLPDRGPGTWVTIVGVLGLVFATAEMFGTRRE
jgi:hypothetical protein